MPENKNVVGEQVRVFRNQHGWSQADFAAKCQLIGWDIDRGTVSKIEAGLRRVTDAELYMLARSHVKGCDPGTFSGGEGCAVGAAELNESRA